jgi:hypothetical protein
MTATRSRRPDGLLLLLLVLLPLGLTAETLRLRMIRASHDETAGIDPGLTDVQPVLRNTLAFKSYALDADELLPLPANGDLVRLRFFRVICEGPADRLTVQILLGQKRILRTVATVRRDQPVILGGFPARPEGIRMFVLTVVPDAKAD